MSRCFIFGALPVGKFPIEPTGGDRVIAADKGYDTVRALGLTPDWIVGDFDSLGETPDAENVIVLPVRKDETDVGYAVEKGFACGCTEFVIYGVVGGMLDHTFANVAIAHDIARRGGKAMLIGDEFCITVLHNASIDFEARQSGRISVFALGGTAKDVTIRGLDYEVEELTIESRSHIGVSNAFVGKEARITVTDGDLLVVWQTEEQKSKPY